MTEWPKEISMNSFSKAWVLEGGPFWLSVLEMHRDKVQIKNTAIAIGKLKKIFTATFKLANAKGFQAMSLRDLSRETGISMGGLYSYISSKNDLASVMEGVLRGYIDRIVADLVSHKLPPAEYLRALIYSQIYMMEKLNPWYYFCFMEVKGLPHPQQRKTLNLEIRYEKVLMDQFSAGVKQGYFKCEDAELLAALITAQLQQWYLKPWKFRRRKIGAEKYANYVYSNLMDCLQVKQI